jgi:hypothetical protein
MTCPECHAAKGDVIDTRESSDATEIRRRRECVQCGYRWTTYERSVPPPGMDEVELSRATSLVEQALRRLKQVLPRKRGKRPSVTVGPSIQAGM